MVSQLVEEATAGDRRALARLFTLLERDDDTLAAIVRATHAHAGRAYTVGITGPPGAGKSTLVDGLVRASRDEGLSVGVLAVDPTSPFSGGAVLGDRIRMQQHFLDRGVFIRSLATKGAHGGLSRVAWAAQRLLDACGRDVVYVETVGVGQTELEVMRVADTVVVTLVPEAGDAVQAMKAGLMEIADVFVVNKTDRSGADRMVSALRSMIEIGERRPDWMPPVIASQAHRRLGIEELHDAIARHRESLRGGLRAAQAPRRTAARGVHPHARRAHPGAAGRRNVPRRRAQRPCRARRERRNRPVHRCRGRPGITLSERYTRAWEIRIPLERALAV